MLLSLIVYLSGLAIVPIYTAFIYDKFKSRMWVQGILHLFIALAIVSGAFLLNFYGLTPQSASVVRITPNLEYLDKVAYSGEVEMRKRKRDPLVQHFERALQIINVKFDEAAYAQRKNDIDIALQLYSEIERGDDENGSFATFPSAAIKNNMAIAYFQKQADHGFKASALLLDAARIEPKPPHELDVIRRNIDAIDKYVNQ